MHSDPRGVLVRGTGTGMWSAGEVLSDYLATCPEVYAGAACLELGCGIGGVGLTLKACGAGRVLLTDLAKQMPLVSRNIEANFPGDETVQVRELDWRCEEHRVDLAPWDCPWSLVVGSDVGYDADLFEPLIATIRSQCTPATAVYLALADREEEGEPNVADFAEAAGALFECSEVHARRLEPHQSMTRILELRLRR